MTTFYRSDVTGRETEDQDEMHTLSIMEDGMVVDDVEVHEKDHPDEVRQALAEILQAFDLDHYGEENEGLEELFG